MTNLRKDAQGKPCLLRIPGYCTFDPEQSVLCHIKCGWCGSIKPPDIVAVVGCGVCHDIIDGRKQTEYSRVDIDAMILRALCEQLVDYTKRGIVRW